MNSHVEVLKKLIEIYGDELIVRHGKVLGHCKCKGKGKGSCFGNGFNKDLIQVDDNLYETKFSECKNLNLIDFEKYYDD